MYQLKVGDFVWLLGDLPLADGETTLRTGTMGVILVVDERGYTVNFEGDQPPMTALNDHNIELVED